MMCHAEDWIVFVRHGPTEWNATGRIQGHRDVPLSEEGRAKVTRWRIPQRYQQALWVSSPLTRAIETAHLMGCESPQVEPCLIEMNWGEWEGCTLSNLRTELDINMRRNEQRGLDFRPAGGESPRQVRDRLQSWLQELAATRQSHIAITHKGVIRAALSLATDWDMTHDPPFRLHWDCAHAFKLNSHGQVSIHETNVSLVDK